VQRRSEPTDDQAFWEELWTKTLCERADTVAARAPNAHLVDALAASSEGRSRTMWAAQRVRKSSLRSPASFPYR
jgi:hypothetical protein